MEILLDGSSELLAHIEAIRSKQFSEILERFDITNIKDLKYSFSFSEDDVILNISDSKNNQLIAKSKTFLIGVTSKNEKYTFEKNTELDSVIELSNNDEIIKEITQYKVAIHDDPYFISVILGAYMIGYGFDYTLTINENIWGLKNVEWIQQVIVPNLD